MKNNNLSDRVNNLSESATLEMTRLSRNLKAEGHDVITLSIGEPDFNTPEHIKEAAKKAINDNHTHYTPVSGFPKLRKAIAGKLKRDSNLDYEPDQIIVSNGAKQSIANVILCIVNTGDEVIVPSPYWVSYPEIVKLAEGKMVEIPTTIETDFKVTPEQIEKVITEKTKAFIFSSPCNPTGSVYSKDELKAIAEVISKHKNIFIISDEIYEYINFKNKHESIARFDFIKDQVIIVNGVSKGYAMTGWRIGYIAAPKFIAKACDTLQGQYTSCASSISQLAAIKAIDTNPSDSEDLKKMLNAFNERRNLVLELLKKIPGIKANIPDGAFYVFPDISDYFGKSDGEKTINNSKDFCMYILEKVYVALVPGGAFGNPDCVRISYATSKEQLIEAISRIKKALAELK
jgi:aspartate aminotransferase